MRPEALLRPPGDLELRIVIPSDPLAVRAALGSVMAGLDYLDTSEDARGAVELTLAEALNNVVEHAYAGGAGRIEMKLAHERRGLRVEVLDDGPALPRGTADARAMPDAACLPEGGFGWALLHALARDLTYSRVRGRNHLRFVVALGEAHAARAA